MNQTTDASQGPIFICGPSRSGTAMLRSSLNLHPIVHLAGETHYFDDLRVRLADAATGAMTEAQQGESENYMLALGHRPYGHHGDPDQGRVSREMFRHTLRDITDGAAPSGDHALQAYCMCEAALAGKRVWGEKTPRHIFRIDEILSAFPDARVVCMIRDVRAVVASYRDWQNRGGFDFEKDPGHKETLAADHERARRSYHPVIIAMLWRGAMRAALAAQERHGQDRVRLQRYEGLVDNPEGELRDLCAWLRLPFEPAILEMPMSNSSYSTFSVGAGVSKEAVDRWREKLSPHEIGVVQMVVGETLTKLGYERIRETGSLVARSALLASTPLAIARAYKANAGRMGNPVKYAVRRLRSLTS